MSLAIFITIPSLCTISVNSLAETFKGSLEFSIVIPHQMVNISILWILKILIF